VPAAISEKQFLDFYDKNVTKIYRYVYFRVGSQPVAQDLSSEAFLRTWQYLEDGKNIGNLSAMTYQICRNLISDYFRQNNNEFPIISDKISDKFLSEPAGELEAKTDDKLEIHRIKASLRYLKVDYQEVIIWRYIDDFSVEEIAQIWGRSPGAVRTLLSRALKALKEAVGKEKKV